MTINELIRKFKKPKGREKDPRDMSKEELREHIQLWAHRECRPMWVHRWAWRLPDGGRGKP